MRIKNVFLAPLAFFFLHSAVAVAQDYQRDFNLPGGSRISIRNVSGNISVSGYDGAFIIVSACKEGRDRDRVEIVDSSGEGDINIYVLYPRHGNVDASVSFEVMVPRSGSYDFEDLASVSGDICVREVAGQVHGQSVSGMVQIQDVPGSVNASSISGDVHVQIAQPAGRANMKFASISGDVVVRAPADLSAFVEMSTISGSLWTDFPIRTFGKWPFIGRSAKGRLGNGEANIKISSISGRICLVVSH
jgi:DUF4097 and DUF4098 domain-containing protein YvlB